jgi:hypothetical protein
VIAQPALSLAREGEKIGRFGISKDTFKILDFAFGGFYLIFKSTCTVSEQEFDALTSYLDQLTTRRSPYFISFIIDLMRVLAVPKLLPSQLEKLETFVTTLQDLDKIPYEDIYEQIEDPVARAEARIDSLGLSRPIDWMLKRLLRNYARESSSFSSEKEAWKRERDLIIRRLQVAQIVGILAPQDERLLSVFEALVTVLPYGMNEVELDVAFAEALPSFLLWPSSLKILTNILRIHQQTTLPKLTIEALQRTDVCLSRDTVKVLFEIIRERGDSAQWARQILGNVSALSEPAERWLTKLIPEEKNPAILHVLMQLHENLVQRRRQSVESIENALVSHIIEQTVITDEPPDSRSLNWLINLGGEPLRRLLSSLAAALEHSAAQTSRYTNTLHVISAQADRIKNPNPAVLAACWLVEPDDWIEDNRLLAEKIDSALAILDKSDTDELIRERIAGFLARAIPRELPRSRRDSVDKQIAIVRALSALHHPHLAFRPLSDAFRMTLEMAQVWEFRDGARELAGAIVETSSSFNPLTLEAFLLVEKALIVSGSSNSELGFKLTPGFVLDEILPLFTHELSPEAVHPLIELVWHYHCFSFPGENPRMEFSTSGNHIQQPEQNPCLVHPPLDQRFSLKSAIAEKKHRYLHLFHKEGFYSDGLILLCALQSLGNVTNLTLAQQQIIWRVYRSSWHALTKSLCLLILGRQRPVTEHTVRELIKVLRQEPFTAFLKTSIKYFFRYLSFHLLYRTSPPEADLNYTYLCQTIAVGMIGNLLKQEKDDLLVLKYRDRLIAALISTTSLFRYGMEPHIAAYTSMGSDTSGTKGMMRMLGATQQEEEHLTSMARPADRAYQVLQDLIATKVLRAFPNQSN